MANRFQLLTERNDNPYRLGRHVRHDERSKDYRPRLAPLKAIRDVKHRRYSGLLDQGRVGSCTGNMLVNCLGNSPLYKAGTKWQLNESLALKLYSRATQLDDPYVPGQYPPHDTGSTALDVCKAGVEASLLSGYDWAFGINEMLRALVIQPVGMGSVWKDSMFHCEPDGRVQVAGTDVGGHEYEAFGIDTAHQRIWFMNSWSNWGVGQTFYMSYTDVDYLLQQAGDVVVPRRK